MDDDDEGKEDEVDTLKDMCKEFSSKCDALGRVEKDLFGEAPAARMGSAGTTRDDIRRTNNIAAIAQVGRVVSSSPAPRLRCFLLTYYSGWL